MSDVEPALTPVWRKAIKAGLHAVGRVRPGNYVERADYEAMDAALRAAVEVFGLTREDVAILRIREGDCADSGDAADFRSLADRIEALLPTNP